MLMCPIWKLTSHYGKLGLVPKLAENMQTHLLQTTGSKTLHDATIDQRQSHRRVCTPAAPWSRPCVKLVKASRGFCQGRGYWSGVSCLKLTTNCLWLTRICSCANQHNYIINSLLWLYNQYSHWLVHVVPMQINITYVTLLLFPLSIISLGHHCYIRGVATRSPGYKLKDILKDSKRILSI